MFRPVIKCADPYMLQTPFAFPLSINLSLVKWMETKIKLFQNMVMLHIKIKGDDECSNIQAHNLSLHTPSTPGWGQRSKLGQNIFLLKVVCCISH